MDVMLTFEHACTKKGYTGSELECITPGGRVLVPATTIDYTSFVWPDIRCSYTQDQLRLYAINGMPVKSYSETDKTDAKSEQVLKDNRKKFDKEFKKSLGPRG